MRLRPSTEGLRSLRERARQEWIKSHPVDTRFIEPGSPWQNGHNESFNGVLRDGCLNRCAFASVCEARLIAERWRQGYNEERPHGALNQIPPCVRSGDGARAEGSGMRFMPKFQP